MCTENKDVRSAERLNERVTVSALALIAISFLMMMNWSGFWSTSYVDREIASVVLKILVIPLAAFNLLVMFWCLIKGVSVLQRLVAASLVAILFLEIIYYASVYSHLPYGIHW